MQKNAAVKTGEPHMVDPAGMDVSDKQTQSGAWWTRLIPMLAFVFGIGAIGLILSPPVAADLNLSFVGELFTSLFGALTDIIPPFEIFVDTGFPVLIKIIIYVAIIGVIGMILYFGRSVLQKIVKMIGF